jgi:hypothetical protein
MRGVRAQRGWQLGLMLLAYGAHVHAGPAADASPAPEAPSAPAADEPLPGVAAPASYWPILLGAQYTYVLQHQTALRSPYEGPLSLYPQGSTQPTNTIGFYGGWAAAPWAQLYLDGEKFMGRA